MNNEKSIWLDVNMNWEKSESAKKSLRLFSLLSKAGNNTGKTFYSLIKNYDYSSTRIHYNLFVDDSIEYLEFPYIKGVTLSSSYLGNLKKLKKIVFPECYHKFPPCMFRGCSSLEEIVFKGKLESSFSFGETALYRTPKLKRIIFEQNTEREIVHNFYYPFGRKNLLSKLVFPNG